MDPSNVSLERVAIVVGYAVVGAAGTAAVALLALRGSQPLRGVIYDTLYAALGPWAATEAATILQFSVACVLAVCVTPVLVEYVQNRRHNLLAVAALFTAALSLLVVALLAAAFGDLLGFLTVLPLFGLLFGGLVWGLFALDVAAESVASFVGGAPVVALFLLLLGVGLGWGGGYYLTATETAATDVNGTVVQFDSVPQVRDALFDPDNCERNGHRVCRLSLRGFEHEIAAGRFLDRHGVRCPYLHAAPRRDGQRPGSLFAQHDGTYYRVTCVAVGD